MTLIDTKTLELKAAKKQRDGDLEYDPHLQEEVLRYNAEPARLHGTVGVTFEEVDGQKKNRYADVIVKLPEPGIPENKIKDPWPVPEGIKYAHRISQYIVTGAVDVSLIPTVRTQVESLKAATEVHLHLYNSVPAIQCDPKSLGATSPGFPGLDGSGVVIGIVDFGCDFRHSNFRQPSGATRICYLWDQNNVTEAMTKDQDPEIKPKIPDTFHTGREFSAQDINRALAAGDENAYGRLGYTPPIAAHGTHVMDIAAGNGREPSLFGGKPGLLPPQASAPGVAPNAQIVFVNLRTFERGFLGNSRYLLEAVDYVFKKADDLGMPAVVNLSLSTTGGPHDGTTLVEQGFDALVKAKPGRAIVSSAGNSYLLQSHITGPAAFTKDRSAMILWQTDPRHTDTDGIKNEMEIWYPGKQELEVILYSPDGRELGSVGLRETKELYAGAQRLGRISHREGDPNNEDNQVDIRLPTLEDGQGGVLGPWKIQVVGKSEGDVQFHAWIEQSERGLARFEGSGIDPQFTLGSICCSNATLTVGAFDTAENASLAPVFEASSAGPIRVTAFNGKKVGEEKPRSKPDLSAPGVTIVAARSHGGVTAMSGTSMAAAHVSGLVALLFQLAQRSGRGPLPFSTTCEILRGGVKPLPGSPGPGGPDPTSLQLGQGRILGSSSVKFLLEKTQPLAKTLSLKANGKAAPSANPSAPLTKFVKTHADLNGSTPTEVIDPFTKLFEDLFDHGESVRVTIEPSN